MSSFNLKRTLPLLFAAALATGASAQVELPKCETARVYGDTARLSVMKYVGTMEEAQALSKKTKKPIFFNCYVSWATTCVAMDQYVFSNQAFAKTMDKKFVNLIVDMRSKEGRELAKKYGVRSYAYYLVLDAQGNVLQRIQGGSKLPDFLQNLELALSPKTSLAGTEAKYKSGKYSRQELFNYLNALRVAGLDSTWRAVALEYMKGMTWADYAKKGNWMFTSVYRNRNNEFYPYFLNNKQAFLANNELLQVNNKFESMLTPALLSYACGDVAYDKADVESYRRDLHTFNMPDSCACLVLCDIADLRGQGRIADLISYMKTSGRYLDKYYGIRANIEQTFKFPNATAEEKKALLAYLQEAVKREEGTKVGMRLRSFVESLANAGKGITFATGTVADILAKAKAEGKMVFLDCYTTWCGPCRVMSNTIFTKNEVGEYFNKHFVSYKLDMERGEGPALGKKYGVKAFPTMLFMDAEGNVRHTIVGSKSANELIEEAKTALKK